MKFHTTVIHVIYEPDKKPQMGRGLYVFLCVSLFIFIAIVYGLLCVWMCQPDKYPPATVFKEMAKARGQKR